MKPTSANSSLIQGIQNFFKRITNSGVYGIPFKKLVFRPNNKSTIQKPNTKTHTDLERHDHKPNTRPVSEKQTLLKEKKKGKGSH